MKEQKTKEPEQAEEESVEISPELSEALAANEALKKELDEAKQKANQILGTASYYKNELDSAKKDFERYKERNKNFEKEAKQKANIDAAKKLFPILDNFDQALSHSDGEVMKGFSMIYVSLKQVLTDLGIVEIETDIEFNPELHNCISTEIAENEEQSEKIAAVFQKGYKIAETNEVIRPATVSIYKLG